MTSPRNTCLNRGLLTGTKSTIPSDPTDFSVGFSLKPEDMSTGHAAYRYEVPCSNLFCRKCDAPVRANDGKGDWRQYFCGCSSHREWRQEWILHNVRDSMGPPTPSGTPPWGWGCGGHPVVELPSSIAGFSLGRDPDWASLVENDAARFPSATKPAERFAGMCTLFARLQGTPHPAEIAGVMEHWLFDAEPHRRVTASYFFARFPLAPGAERLTEAAAAQLESSTGQHHPYAIEGADLAVCLLLALGARARNGAPYTNEVRDWFRAELLRSGFRWRPIPWVVLQNDREWMRGAITQIEVMSPEMDRSIRHFRRNLFRTVRGHG